MRQLLITACITLICACNNNTDFDASLDAQVSKPAAPSAGSTQPSINTNTGPVINQNAGTINNTPVITAATSAGTTAQVTEAGKNPPHGKPGHRCDIPVGAPLNTPVSTTTATGTPIPQNIVVQPQATSPKTVTAPGMNPPHGEPGHRCDIAVGAPLNTTPAKKEEETKKETTADSSGH